MYTIKFERQFIRDYKRTMAQYPNFKTDFLEALTALRESGRVPAAYNPHFLNNPEISFFGYMEFHLSDGRIDILAIYKPHKTNPEIRMVRMGSHKELFSGRAS